MKTSQNITGRSHSFLLSLERTSRNEPRTHFLLNRIVTPWNNLPKNIALTPSVNSFKRQLDLYLNKGWGWWPHLVTFDHCSLSLLLLLLLLNFSFKILCSRHCMIIFIYLFYRVSARQEGNTFIFCITYLFLL